MSTTAARAKSIFLEAVEIHEYEERMKFLDDACGEDTELRRRAERLIRAHEMEDDLLDRTELIRPDDLAVGDRVGHYKILQILGEGGMGTVYMAEQIEPVKRKVALKVVKVGMDTKQFMARFEAERQALAMMDHPGIAKVLDAGATESGRPYFAMELVKGAPITDYCDQHKLSTRQRLELFADVCRAVQHAHQKGVIHRDLKPSNVMVARFDSRPVVKVIDFGVAKATNQELTNRTMFTEFGQIIGTVEYMSPEQAQLNQLDVDTRSDIYSLGVLLYELLTGVPPFDRKRLRTAALDEVMRIIREEEPPKPSTRVSALGDQSEAVSANRDSDITGLGRSIRGDVDLIVMKALDKDRGRRYETANALAADIRRYLVGDPIEARPDSSWYRLRKTVARNRGVFATAAGVLLLSAIGVFALYRGKTESDERRVRIQSLLDTQRELIKERVLQQVVAGNTVDARRELEVAKELEISENWIAMIEALIYQIEDTPDLAVAELSSFVGEDPSDNIGAYALLIFGLGDAGNEPEMMRRMVELRDALALTPATTFEEHLLVGVAFCRWFPAEAVDHLETACRLRPESLIARLWLGDARCYEAMRTGNGAEAVEIAEQAVADMRAVHRFLPESPIASRGFVQSQLVLAHRNRLHNGSQIEFQESLEALRPQIERLSQWSDVPSALFQRAMFQLLSDNSDKAVKELLSRHASGQTTDNYLANFLASCCFQSGDIERGFQLLGTIHGPLADQSLGYHHLLELSSPDAHERLDLLILDHQKDVRGILEGYESSIMLFVDWWVARLHNDLQTARSIGDAIRRSGREDLWPEEHACADFMCRASDAATLLERCKDSQVFTAYAHCLIGIDLLAEGRRADARTHFEAAAQTGDFHITFYWWGKALAARAEDPTWVPWVDSPNATVTQPQQQSKADIKQTQ